MKIYVVTQGEYSGYGIITATLDKDLAEAIAKKYDSEFNRTQIEEFEDAEIMLKPCWFVRFNQDGTVKISFDDSDHTDGYRRLNRCIADDSGEVYVHVSAADADSAIKIAAEKRAQYLAEQAGII